MVFGVLNIMEKEAHFIENWSVIACFLGQLSHIFRMVESRKITEGKVVLSERLNMDIVERCMMEAGSKCDRYFGKFMLAVISVGREEIEKEVLFMTHKFFELVDSNPKKFLLVVEDFMPFLINFTKHLENTSPEICISVTDMLKQTFAKLLRLPKTTQQWVNGPEAEFWKLFQNLATHRNK